MVFQDGVQLWLVFIERFLCPWLDQKLFSFSADAVISSSLQMRKLRLREVKVKGLSQGHTADGLLTWVWSPHVSICKAGSFEVVLKSCFPNTSLPNTCTFLIFYFNLFVRSQDILEVIGRHQVLVRHSRDQPKLECPLHKVKRVVLLVHSWLPGALDQSLTPSRHKTSICKMND